MWSSRGGKSGPIGSSRVTTRFDLLPQAETGPYLAESDRVQSANRVGEDSPGEQHTWLGLALDLDGQVPRSARFADWTYGMIGSPLMSKVSNPAVASGQATRLEPNSTRFPMVSCIAQNDAGQLHRPGFPDSSPHKTRLQVPFPSRIVGASRGRLVGSEW